jgi:hypothetical protein
LEGVVYVDRPLPSARASYGFHVEEKTFKLAKCLGEGAYGKAYKAEEPVVIKIALNDTSAWELHISRSLRRKVPSHMVIFLTK